MAKHIIPALLGSSLRRATSTGGTLYDRVEYTNMPFARNTALFNTAGTPLHASNSFARPRLGQEESTGNSPGSNPVSGQAHRLSKWRHSHVRVGGNTTYRNAQNSNPDMIVGSYNPWVETQYAGSPYAQNGSGGRYSHEQYYGWLDTISVGGNPHGGRMGSDNGGLVDDNWALFPGHVVVSVPFKTTTFGSALTGSNDTVTYTGTGGTSQFQVGETSFIYTPHNASTEWLAEASTATPYTKCEAVVLVSKTSNTLTFEQLRLPNNQLFGSMGNNGSVSHPIGSRIVQCMKGQASIPRLNFRFNPTEFCPRDSYGGTPGQGRSWNEFNVQWVANNFAVDSSGNDTGITKAYGASDVNDTYLATKYYPDINGDGVRDNGYVNNENAYTNGMSDELALFKSYVRGKPSGSSLTTETTPIFGDFGFQHGGVKEEPIPGATGMQTESICDGQSQHDSDATVYDIAAMGDRHIKSCKTSYSMPMFSTVVMKFYSLFQHPNSEASTATHNNLVFFHLAFTSLSGGTLCIRDSSPTTSRPNNNDPWPQLAAVVSDPNDLDGQVLGQAIENTNGNQNLLKRHREWLGLPVGPIENISGVNLMDTGSYTPIYDVDYSVTTDVSNWVHGGNNKGSSSIIHNASTGALRLQNIKGDPNWGALNIQSPAIFDNSHRGKEYVIYLEYSSSTRSLYQVQAGKSNNHELQLYPEPGFHNHVMISGKFSGSEDFSGLGDSVRYEVGRLVGRNIANNWLDTHRIKVWVGDNIRQTANGQYFQRGWAGYNATPRSITYNLRGNFIKPITTADHSQSHTTGGQTISSVTIPPNSGALLVRAADNYDYVSSAYDPSINKVTITVPQGEGVNYGDYVDLGGVVRSPVVTQNVAA